MSKPQKILNELNVMQARSLLKEYLGLHGGYHWFVMDHAAMRGNYRFDNALAKRELKYSSFHSLVKDCSRVVNSVGNSLTNMAYKRRGDYADHSTLVVHFQKKLQSEDKNYILELAVPIRAIFADIHRDYLVDLAHRDSPHREEAIKLIRNIPYFKDSMARDIDALFEKPSMYFTTVMAGLADVTKMKEQYIYFTKNNPRHNNDFHVIVDMGRGNLNTKDEEELIKWTMKNDHFPLL